MDKKYKPSHNELLKQAVSDWFGKEVQTGYTTTYVWMANQFGHFNLGFLATMIFAWVIKLINPEISASGYLLILPVAEILIWIIKETYDYKVAINLTLKNNIFPPDKLDVALDAGTAVLFISFGIIVSYLSFVSLIIALCSFIVVLALAMLPGKYWMAKKVCFQQADLPYQYRLSDFPSDIGKQSVGEMIDFYKVKPNSFNHLIIFGKRQTGKSNMAIGIGTESSFILNKVRFATYFNFLQLVDEDTSKRVYFNGKYIWNWNEVEILIIDDVNPVSEQGELIKPIDVASSINSLKKDTKEELLNTKTVWVIGLPETYSDSLISDWHKMFSECLETEMNKIGCVVLTKPISQATLP